MKTLTLLSLFLLLMIGCTERPQIIFISPDGSDTNIGTQTNPVTSLDKALLLAKENNFKKIVFMSGLHQFTDKQTITHVGTDTLTLSGQEGAIISGGVEISGFKKVKGNLFVADVSHLEIAEFDNYRQLFKNGMRLPRAQTPNGDDYFLTAGQVEKYNDAVAPWDFTANAKNQIENPELNTCFAFTPGDLKAEWVAPYVEVLVHHSWESCWQTIRKLDMEKSEIWMNTPSVWPINFFGSHGDRLRYKLFNHKAFIDQPGEWMIDPEQKKLFYLAEEGEDPETSTFILPTVSELLEVKESNNLRFENLTFSYSDYKMNIYSPGVHAWEDTVYNPSWAVRAKKLYPDWSDKFYPGYSEPQAAVNAGEAIEISQSSNILFNNCTFKGLGSNAIWIKENSSHVSVVNSVFDDLGAGGVKIGTPRNDINYWKLLAENMAHHNIVKGCTIKNGGQVFAGCVAIWIGQSYDNVIEDNEIFNYPYSGVSLGWNWNTEPNHTKRCVIRNNKIHDVLQVLTDGGGIYTLGFLEDCIIDGNEIYNIFRAEHAAGSNSNGIFFDEGSEGIVMKNNYIHHILNSPIRFNNTHHERMKEISNNFFDVEHLRAKHNNNYNTDFDENGFARFKIEDNHYSVKNGIAWKKSLGKLD